MHLVNLGLALLQAALAAQGTALGTLTMGGEVIALQHVRAVRVADWFDRSKTMTRVVISNVPLAIGTIQDPIAIQVLSKAGNLHALVLDVEPSREAVLAIYSSKLEDGVDSPEPVRPSQFRVFTDKRIEGSISGESDRAGRYRFEVTIATDIAAAAAAKAQRDAEAIATAETEAVKTYREFRQALRSGDRDRIIALSTPRAGAWVSHPDFARQLVVVQRMAGGEVQVQSVLETRDWARLTVTRIQDGRTRNGKVTLQRSAGKWLFDAESWK